MPKNSDFKTLFANRIDAAKQLLDDMPTEEFRGRDVVAIAVSEGGVEIADTLASEFESDMDILLSEPILSPKNPELAIAMISETKELVMNIPLVDAFGIDEEFIYDESERLYNEKVLGYINKYRQGEHICDVSGRTVILADECIETGITILMAIKSMISMGAKNVYVATPVLDKQVYENLIPICDGVFCPHKIDNYISIEYYYDDLEKIEFEEIERILKRYE